jgi:hypothetical protein
MKLNLNLVPCKVDVEVNFGFDEDSNLPFIEDYWTPNDSHAWILMMSSDEQIRTAIWQAYDEQKEEND